MKTGAIFCFIALGIFFAVSLLILPVTAWATMNFNGTTINNSNYNTYYNNDAFYLGNICYMTYPFPGDAYWMRGQSALASGNPTLMSANASAMRSIETTLPWLEIYQSMAKSSDSFPINSGNVFSNIQAEQASTQRIGAITAMNSFNTYHQYDMVDRNPTGMPVTSYTTYWTGNISGPGEYHFLFDQSSGNTTPHLAILTLTNPYGLNQTYGDCTGAIMACFWQGTLNALGNTTFDSVFNPTSDSTYSPLNMSRLFYMWDGSDYAYPSASTPMTLGSGNTSLFIPGERVYFRNYNYYQVLSSPYVNPITTNDPIIPQLLIPPIHGSNVYPAQGENAIYMGGNIFSGLRLASQTADAMKLTLMNDYNAVFAKLVTYLSGNSGYFYNGTTHSLDMGVPAVVKITDFNMNTYITIGNVTQLNTP